MERLIEAMLIKYSHNPILSIFLYVFDAIGSVLTALWLTGAMEFVHIYILIATSISITFTAIIKYSQWRDRCDERKKKKGEKAKP